MNHSYDADLTTLFPTLQAGEGTRRANFVGSLVRKQGIPYSLPRKQFLHVAWDKEFINVIVYYHIYKFIYLFL
jgi:hypothetical protein